MIKYDTALAGAAPMEDEDSFQTASVASSRSMADVSVRSEFKDTALFRVVTLAEDGTGTVTFKFRTM